MSQNTLQRKQDALQRAQQSTLVGLTVAATIANSTSITSTIKGQLVSTSVTAAEQYQPPEIICVPAEVQAFLRNTQNVGVSVMPFRFQDCKGNTSVSFPS
jgi:hypothetical protein